MKTPFNSSESPFNYQLFVAVFPQFSLLKFPADLGRCGAADTAMPRWHSALVWRWQHLS